MYVHSSTKRQKATKRKTTADNREGPGAQRQEHKQHKACPKRTERTEIPSNQTTTNDAKSTRKVKKNNNKTKSSMLYAVTKHMKCHSFLIMKNYRFTVSTNASFYTSPQNKNKNVRQRNLLNNVQAQLLTPTSFLLILPILVKCRY